MIIILPNSESVYTAVNIPLNGELLMIMSKSGALVFERKSIILRRPRFGR